VQNSKNSTARLDILAAISGVLIAFQSRANGELSRQLDSGAQAALISFSSGLIVVALVTVFNPKIRFGLKGLKNALVNREIPRWRLFAGMLGGSFVAVQSHVVPIIGVALFSVASIAGQTATSLIVDRIGLTGGGPKPISPRRITAALITVFAVLVSVLEKLESVNFSILSVLLALFGGAFVGIQRALNGQINEFTKQSYATSLLNFVMGTIFLILFSVFLIIVKGEHLVALPKGPWWIYTGGVIGVIYIASTSLIVQHLGVLTFTLFSVGGQLVASLFIDFFSPSEGVSVSWYLISGIAMTYLGVLVGGARQARLPRK
jgi:transporter family-2 protein